MQWGDLTDEHVGMQVIVSDPRPWNWPGHFEKILGWVRKGGIGLFYLEELPDHPKRIYHFQFWAEVEVVDGRGVDRLSRRRARRSDVESLQRTG